MDQRRNSGFSRNTKLASIHHHTSEKVLQQQISSLEDRFSKDTKRLRKETQDIKKDFYALQKQKGTLNTNSMLKLEVSPGIQDRFTRNKRFGRYDPAMLKAKDESSDEDSEEILTESEKRRKSLLKGAASQLSTISAGFGNELEDEETVVDPYKNRLKHILDNSKIAKEARLTALKVKALEAIKPRPSNGKLYAEKGLINLSRRDSTDSVGSFSHSLLRRNRGLSVPNSRNQSADLSRTMNVFKRLSLPAGTVYHSGRHSERETCFSPSRMNHFDRRSFSATEVNGQRARALSESSPRFRKRSQSLMIPPDVSDLQEGLLTRRRKSDTPTPAFILPQTSSIQSESKGKGGINLPSIDDN